jgi:hypothetical protein
MGYRAIDSGSCTPRGYRATTLDTSDTEGVSVINTGSPLFLNFDLSLLLYQGICGRDSGWCDYLYVATV